MTMVSIEFAGIIATSSGLRTAILSLPAKRAPSITRTFGAGSHRISRATVSVASPADRASPQP